MFKTQFITQQFKDGTFTDEAQLANALLIKPEILDTLVYAYGTASKETYGIMQLLTQGMGRTTEKTPKDRFKPLGNSEYQYPLMGCDTRTIPITDTVTPDPNTTNVGQNFTSFTVPLAEKYFKKTEIVIFADQSIARIVEDPYTLGNNWCYTMVLMTGNAGDFIAPWALQVGKEVAWSHSAVEEGSVEGGGVKVATPMWFKQQMNIMRMEWGMTGTAKNTKVMFRFEGKKGKTDLWMYHIQHKAMKQFLEARERALFLNKYNRLQDGTIPHIGSNGRPIMMGSGLDEQLSGTNLHVVNQLTEDTLRYMLIDIMNQKGSENTKRVVFTGDGGFDEFNKAMKRALGGIQPVVVDTTFIHKKTGNELGFGSQFTTYKGFYGTEFTLVRTPLLNDKTIFHELDPVTGFTRKSYEMYFIDFSDYDGVPNVQFVTRGVNGENRQMKMWFQGGSTTPDFNGDTGASAVMRSTSFDGFYMHILSEFGLIIHNPLKCGKIIINRQ